jgi:hypothetical protein
MSRLQVIRSPGCSVTVRPGWLLSAGHVTCVDQTVGIHIDTPECLWRYRDCAADDACRNQQVAAFSSLVYLLGLVLPETIVASYCIQRVYDRIRAALSVRVTTPGA